MDELCVSTRPNQLLRWQQAFPEGRIFPSLQKLRPSLQPDVLVWLHADTLPGNQMDDAVQAIREASPATRVVVLSCMPNPKDALAAFKIGAMGYCHALSTPEMLQQVGVVVRNGGMWIGPDLLPRLVGAIGQMLSPAAPSQEPSALGKLSSREQEVARQVGSGASNKEISQALGITERTVKAHMGSIFEKLGIRDRLQLALLLSQEESDDSPQISV